MIREPDLLSLRLTPPTLPALLPAWRSPNWAAFVGSESVRHLNTWLRARSVRVLTFNNWLGPYVPRHLAHKRCDCASVCFVNHLRIVSARKSAPKLLLIELRILTVLCEFSQLFIMYARFLCAFLCEVIINKCHDSTWHFFWARIVIDCVFVDWFIGGRVSLLHFAFTRWRLSSIYMFVRWLHACHTADHTRADTAECISTITSLDKLIANGSFLHAVLSISAHDLNSTNTHTIKWVYFGLWHYAMRWCSCRLLYHDTNWGI